MLAMSRLLSAASSLILAISAWQASQAFCRYDSASRRRSPPQTCTSTEQHTKKKTACPAAIELLPSALTSRFGVEGARGKKYAAAAVLATMAADATPIQLRAPF